MDAGQNRHSVKHSSSGIVRFAWLSIPIFLVLILFIWLAEFNIVIEPPYLFPLLNFIFATAVSLFVAYLALISFARNALVTVLMLGSGMLFFGTNSFILGIAVQLGHINVGVTVYNTSMLFAGICHLLAAAALVIESRIRRNAILILSATYALVLTVTGLLTYAAANGLTPVFFIQGIGPTPLRQAVLGTAISLHVLSGIIIALYSRRFHWHFGRWYALSLWMIAIGLFSFSIISYVGSPLAWSGRAALYVGGLYMLVAVLTAAKKDGEWDAALQSALKESQERYRVLAEATFEGIFISKDGVIVDANEHFGRMLGYSQGEVIGHRIAELIPEEDRERVLGTILSGRDMAGEHSMLKKDGGRIVVESHGRTITRNGSKIRYSAVRDITDRKQDEDALRESEERFELLAKVAERLLKAENPQTIVEDLCRLVMEHIDCKFFFNYLVEVPDKQIHLNAYAGIPKEAAESIRQLDFGVAVCGCVARDCERIIAEDIQNSNDSRTQLVKSFGVQAYCCHPLMMHDRLIGTLSFGTKTRPRFTAVEVALMKSVCDQVAVAMQRQFSKRELGQLNESLEQRVVERTKLAEDRSMQLRSLAVEMIEVEERERRRFADLLHDDLQQMLASARFQLQAVNVDKSAEPELEHVCQILEEAIAKSRRLTHELSPPVMHHGSLSLAMEWLSGQMNEHFGLNVHLEAENIPELKNSPIKVFVFRAVQELLFNIVKHAGVKNASVLLSGKNSHLNVTVSDQGKGFDKADLDRTNIQKSFGLISIRERAHHIGGELKIESEPGRGSRFYLTVPVQPATTESVHVSSEKLFDAVVQKTPSRAAGLRLLFVDDHKVMRQGLIRLISSQPDIEVAGEAANGKEALELARQLRPDVILMDISMPEMDGIEATRRIKAELPEVRVIGLSMFEDKGSAQNIINAGADSFVPKTASSAELLKAIYGTSAS